MRIDHEPTDVHLLQNRVDLGHIPALGQPDSRGIHAEAFAVGIAADEDLGAHRLGDGFHQRQEAVRGSAGDDLEDAVFLELGKRSDDVAADFIAVETQCLAKGGLVVPGDVLERLVARGAVHLHRGELASALEVTLGAALQERIAEHRAQGRGQREGDFRGNLVRDHAAQDFQQRDVALSNGLEEPVLFKKLLVLGMAHPRQMGVEEEGKRTLAHKRGKDLRCGAGRDKRAEPYRTQPGQLFKPASARPRWLRRFLVSAPSSAKVSPNPSGTNSGS